MTSHWNLRNSRIISKGCDKSNELNGNSLLQASIFDRIVSYDRDDLDVFKELEIVARSIEAARSGLVAK
jgi:hypothetical protein